MSITDSKTIKDVVKDKFQNINLSANDIINFKNELSIELNKKTSKLS
jgi:hypothetical protein